MYCEGYWGEGVCTADMNFCGEPTADGDEIARCVRVWYEAHRETWRDRSRFLSKYGRMWERGFADEFMLGLINEIARVSDAADKQTRKPT